MCKKDSVYEIGRVADVLNFGANEALRDDGQVFSCDLTPHGKKRKVITMRDPLLGVITAITPFNHPMNQVAHKVVPSIATNNRMVLKPSEKVPLSAYYFADLLYEAGLPPEMFQVLTGDPREIADETADATSTSTSSRSPAAWPIGKYIAVQGRLPPHRARTGWQRPADRDGRRRSGQSFSDLAVQGSYKNSGQRCTAVKRMLVHQKPWPHDFTERRRRAKTRRWKHGDPMPTAAMRHGHRDRRPGRRERFEEGGERSCERRAPACSPATSAMTRCIHPLCSTAYGPR